VIGGVVAALAVTGPALAISTTGSGSGDNNNSSTSATVSPTNGGTVIPTDGALPGQDSPTATASKPKTVVTTAPHTLVMRTTTRSSSTTTTTTSTTTATTTTKPKPAKLVLDLSKLPREGTVDEVYVGKGTVTGGTPPYTFISFGAPKGLAVSSAGATLTLSGTPTTAGDYTFSVTVTDDDGKTADAQVTISIAETN
jgi:hypothetical protein